MTKFLWKKVLANLSIIFLLAGLFLLFDQILRHGYLFKITDIFVLRPTHEKFALLFFLSSFYIRANQKKYGR